MAAGAGAYAPVIDPRGLRRHSFEQEVILMRDSSTKKDSSMKNLFPIALAVALISLVGSIQSEASTISPAGGQLGTNPQGESFGDPSVTASFNDTFYVTVSGTGLQPLDIEITSGPEIDLGQGFEVYILGVSIPENYTIPTGSLDYSVEPGSYTIIVLGTTESYYIVSGDLAYMTGSYEGTITAGAPIPGTPLPAALPLFAGGLGVMGLFGWRRKRKAQAVAA